MPVLELVRLDESTNPMTISFFRPTVVTPDSHNLDDAVEKPGRGPLGEQPQQRSPLPRNRGHVGSLNSSSIRAVTRRENNQWL